MKISAAFALLCIFGLSPAAQAGDDKTVFKIVDCDVLEAHTAAVAFRNDEGQGRYITFMDAYREFKVAGAGNSAFRKDSLKGVLKWDQVTAVRTVPTDASGMAGQLRIEYRRDGRDRMIDLGVIDEPCLMALKKRYAAHLNFEPS